MPTFSHCALYKFYRKDKIHLSLTCLHKSERARRAQGQQKGELNNTMYHEILTLSLSHGKGWSANGIVGSRAWFGSRIVWISRRRMTKLPSSAITSSLSCPSRQVFTTDSRKSLSDTLAFIGFLLHLPIFVTFY